MSDDAERLMQLVFGGYPAQVVHAFTTLDLADHLATGSLTVPELARLSDCHEPSLRRLLRAATYLGLVRGDGDGRFDLTPTGRLTGTDAADGIKNLVMDICGERMWRALGRLSHTVRTGEPAIEHVFGRSGYEWLADNPDEEAVFHSAMAETSHADAPAVVEVCDLSTVRSIVDVGGGNGVLMSSLLEANQQLAGTIFDSEVGLRNTPVVLVAARVAERCELVAGDFFADPVPSGRDVYTIKHVLNDWDDEHVIRILRNCRESMRPDSTLMIIESIMPDGSDNVARESMVVVMSDLCALVGSGGQLRTAAEFRTLLAAAELTLTDIANHQEKHGLSILHAVRS